MYVETNVEKLNTNIHCFKDCEALSCKLNQSVFSPNLVYLSSKTTTDGYAIAILTIAFSRETI